MSAVIGGWVAGYAMAIICTIVFTWLLIKADGPTFVERMLGEGTPVGIAAVPLSLGFMYGWTIIGLTTGIMYDAADLGSAPNFLGSPSAPFVYGSGVISLLPLPFALVLSARRWWLWLVLSLSFFGLFGWAMPIMAAH